MTLLERLELATEGSRELDAEIARILGCVVIRDDHGYYIDKALVPENMPHYTTSIDAALTLVPPGYRWVVQTLGNGNGTYVAATSPPGVALTLGDILSPIPAIALVIACLRARESRT